jgi:anti-sigma B factor antagonist
MLDIDVDERLAEPGEMVIRAAREGNAFQLSLYGELDISSARVLERRIQMARSSRSEQVVLDLSGLQFMDSAGLRALLQVQENLRDAGQNVALLRGPRAVQQVFDLTDATKLFEFDG